MPEIDGPGGEARESGSLGRRWSRRQFLAASAGAAALTAFEWSPLGALPVGADSAANPPVDPQATPNATALLTFLHGLGVKGGSTGRTLSGAMIGVLPGAYPASTKPYDFDQYQLTTGKTPALMGVTDWFAWNGGFNSNGVPTYNWNQGVSRSDPGLNGMMGDHAAAGGVLMITFLPFNPMPVTTTIPQSMTGAALGGRNAITSLTLTSTANLPQQGNGAITADDGGHIMSWTSNNQSTNTLGGCVFLGASASSTLTAGEPFWASGVAGPATPLPLGRSPSSMADPDAIALTPLQWGTGAAAQLGANPVPGQGFPNPANSNLNALLDNIALVAGQLGAFGIPVIFRPWAEDNNANGLFSWWASVGTNATTAQKWVSSVWQYTLGYLTGNGGFVGQPVTAQPVHNLLFAYAQTATGNHVQVGNTPPSHAYVDIYGIDAYSYMGSTITYPSKDLTKLGGISGWSNMPAAFLEGFAGPGQGMKGVGHDVTISSGNLDVSTWTGAGVNLSFTVDNAFQAAAGFASIPTTNGVIEISYTSAQAKKVGQSGSLIGCVPVTSPPSGTDFLGGSTGSQPGGFIVFRDPQNDNAELLTQVQTTAATFLQFWYGTDSAVYQQNITEYMNSPWIWSLGDYTPTW